MSLVCSISNEAPETPVLSPVSGCIFEKRLLEKYVNETGLDPVNGEKLSLDQIINVKVPENVRARPPSATSIPAILKLFQDEWDAVMLHSFTLKQQLQTARQELSHALYQHDAACRVIARLTREVTAAREALATLKPQAPSTVVVAGGDKIEKMEEDEKESEVLSITPDVIQKLEEKSSLLTSERRKRGKTVPEGLVDSEKIKNYKQVSSHVGLHSASLPGILSIDICLSDSSKIITGGVDKNAVVFNKNEESVVAVLQGHQKKVTYVCYHDNEDLVFTGSNDNTIRIWGVSRSTPCAHVISVHQKPISGLSLHATGDYLLASSLDGYWSFNDLRNGKTLAKVASGDESAISSSKFHPDGVIFSTGTSSSIIKIWDIKNQTNVANFTGHKGSVGCMAFSENGYHLATAGEDGAVKLWDLRKLKNFKTINMEDKFEVKDLSFDYTGTYLAVAGTEVRIFLSKQWVQLSNLNNHTSLATGCRFGENASFLATVSMDRSLKIFSL